MIAAVVLAAGGSTRMGRIKQLIDLGDGPLVRRAAECAGDAGCRPVRVVVGAHRQEVAAALVGPGGRFEIVENLDWRRGIGSSIRVGVESLVDLGDRLEAVMLLGCDQPRLTARLLRRLMEAYRADGERTGRRVACAYAGTIGSPALFDRSLLDRLGRLRGDSGARNLLVDEPSRTVTIPWEEGRVDLDRPQDLRRLRGERP